MRYTQHVEERELNLFDRDDVDDSGDVGVARIAVELDVGRSCLSWGICRSRPSVVTGDAT